MKSDPGLTNYADIAPVWVPVFILAVVGVLVLCAVLTPKRGLHCPEGYALVQRDQICIKDAVRPTSD